MAIWAWLAGAVLMQATPATPPAELPPPPPALAAALDDQGYPDPDRIDWLRGAFDDASPAQKAQWLSIQEWLTTCSRIGTAKVRSDLAAMGVTVTQDHELFPLARCMGVSAFQPPRDLRASWPDFQRAYATARHDWAVFRYGAKLGFESAPFDPGWVNGEALVLLHATVREQVYRRAINWSPEAEPDPGARSALHMFLWMHIAREDAKNLTMLRQLVADKGWPAISAVGKPASNAAWLLVQHADRDPAFQLRVLRLMKPMVAKGEVEKQNYAYLYDRVMLKLVGTQRYGTQATCKDGQRIARPLEQGVDLDAERASMGLPPEADYMADMNRMFGPCPKTD